MCLASLLCSPCNTRIFYYFTSLLSNIIFLFFPHEKISSSSFSLFFTFRNVFRSPLLHLRVCLYKSSLHAHEINYMRVSCVLDLAKKGKISCITKYYAQTCWFKNHLYFECVVTSIWDSGQYLL